jgi:hypothetical protein
LDEACCRYRPQRRQANKVTALKLKQAGYDEIAGHEEEKDLPSSAVTIAHPTGPTAGDQERLARVDNDCIGGRMSSGTPQGPDRSFFRINIAAARKHPTDKPL